MPYRENAKPNTKKPWDKCECENHRMFWFRCCRCGKETSLGKQFCGYCGHARDLKPGEEDKCLSVLLKRTNSTVVR